MARARTNLGNVFYVYVYETAAERPLYIGKGHARRDRSHLSLCKSDQTTIFYKKLLSLLKRGEEVVVRRLMEGLSEAEAFFWEQFYIASLGRKIYGDGCLYNQGEGGNGNAGWRWSEENKRKLSAARRAAVTPESRKRSSDVSKSLWQREDVVDKHYSRSYKNKWGMKGVSRTRGGKWRASINVNKRHIFLGEYDTLELAGAAYNIGVDVYHNGRGVRNSVSCPPPRICVPKTRDLPTGICRLPSGRYVARGKGRKGKTIGTFDSIEQAVSARHQFLAGEIESLVSRHSSRPKDGKYKGILERDGKWRASIVADGVRHNLGTFPTPEAAALAYNIGLDRLCQGKGSRNSISREAAETWLSVVEEIIATTATRSQKFRQSGYKGISQTRGKWRAKILINGKSKHLGYFPTLYQAILAYNDGVDALLDGNGEKHSVPLDAMPRPAARRKPPSRRKRSLYGQLTLW